MSLILDALNRADKERNEQQQTPSLQAAPVTAAADKSPLLRWGLELLILLLVIAGLLYWLVFRSPAPPEVTAPPAPVIAPAKQPATPVNTASPQPVATALASPEKTASNPAIADLYRQPISNQPDNFTKTASTSPTVPESRPKPPPKPRPKPSGQDILRQIPLLATMSSRFRESIPNIEYSLHVYNEEDGSGIVNLNGSMRKIGAEIAPGLRVIAILPDSVVLDYQGTQFRLLALNSWMNFN